MFIDQEIEPGEAIAIREKAERRIALGGLGLSSSEIDEILGDIPEVGGLLDIG